MFFEKKWSLLSKNVGLIIVNLILLAGSITLTVFYLLYQQIESQVINNQEANMRVAWSIIKQKGTDFRVAEGKLFIGDYIVNNNFDIVDTIKDLVGGTATIFMGDNRVSTNILKEDNSRAIGTKLGPGLVMDTVL